MTRSAYEIASTGVDDLYTALDYFNNIHAIFILMLQSFPEDSTAHALAQLGVAEINDRSMTVFQWAECMAGELDDLAEGAPGALLAVSPVSEAAHG